MSPSGVVVLTDRRLAARPLPEVVAAAVSGGASWVVLRERDLGYADRKALATSLREVAPVIVAGPDPLSGSAVHLAAADPLPDRPLRTIGRSCHGAEELSRLSVEHYVMLSPVFPTSTKPGHGPALTPEGAAGLGSPVPWLALGGVDSADRAWRCGAAGAAGIAVLGAVMRAADPERVVRELAAGFAAGRATRRRPGSPADDRAGHAGSPAADGRPGHIPAGGPA